MTDKNIADKILKAIEKVMINANNEFFSYAWRDKVENALLTESRFSELVKWIDKEIESRQAIIGVFNPADKNEKYINAFYNRYKENIGDLAMLVNMRELLVDNRCTTQQRENIEFTICKIFGCDWCEELKCYV